MDENESPIVAAKYRCARCGQIIIYDVAALSASKLHSSPATGEEPIKPNCSACGAPLEHTYRRIVEEEPPPVERDRSWIENATHQGDTPANPAPVPELVPTPAAEPVPLEQASTKLPEPEPVV